MFNNDLGRFFIGYDKVAEKLANIADQSAKLVQNYPPFNIKKVEDNKYAIELALAGFDKKDIDIEFDDGKLTVTGNVETKDVPDTFVWKGISNKSFTRQFTLVDNVEVSGAEFTNGLLSVYVETIPLEKNSRKIDISSRPVVKKKVDG